MNIDNETTVREIVEALRPVPCLYAWRPGAGELQRFAVATTETTHWFGFSEEDPATQARMLDRAIERFRQEILKKETAACTT